jgi:DNA polymerase beta
MEEMMPRAEIEMFRASIAKALKRADPEYGFEIMGSYRRGEMLSSDMDVVVWHP